MLLWSLLVHLHQRSLEKCGEYCCSLCYWLATLRVVECARLVYLIGIFTFTCILLVHEQMAFDSPILSVIPLNFDSLFHNLLHRVNGKVWRLQFLHPCFRPPLVGHCLRSSSLFAWDVHSCTIPCDLWALRYRKDDRSAISIAISLNRYEP